MVGDLSATSESSWSTLPKESRWLMISFRDIYLETKQPGVQKNERAINLHSQKNDGYYPVYWLSLSFPGSAILQISMHFGEGSSMVQRIVDVDPVKLEV